MSSLLHPIFLLLSYVVINTQQQQSSDDNSIDDNSDDDDDDDCAFISGQHCDSNGICKYCAMCLQSSCILSKTIDNRQLLDPINHNNCNSTQFGTTNIYDWYDYCLSSGNDSTGDYCATSTECYQYRKTAEPTVTYAWHNLTCNPNTCMLTASNGSPPPVPVPPTNLSNVNGDSSGLTSNKNGKSQEISQIGEEEQAASSSEHTRNQHHYYHFRNPAMIALTVICSLLLFIAVCWMLRHCRKKYLSKGTILGSTTAVTNYRRSKRKHWPLSCNRSDSEQQRQQQGRMPSMHGSMSSIPSTAPPSFSSIPPEFIGTTDANPNAITSAGTSNPQLRVYTTATDRQLTQMTNDSDSANSSVNNNNVLNIGGESLPSYLTPYLSPPKYEQAIVTQIRGLREDCSSSNLASDTIDPYHCGNTAPIPSMWVPVYFTQQHLLNFAGNRRPENSTDSSDTNRATAGELVRLPGSHPIHSYWLQLMAHNSISNPFDDPPSSTVSTESNSELNSQSRDDQSQ